MNIRKILLVAVIAAVGFNGPSQVLVPRSGEFFQTTRSGPGEIASAQFLLGAMTFPIGLPLLVTGWASAIVDEAAISPIVDLVCLPYDLFQLRHGYFIRVTDDDGNPVAGAKFIANSHISRIASTKLDEITDVNGEIYISRLAKAHYIDSIYLSKVGFYESNPTVNHPSSSVQSSFRPSKCTPDADGRIVCNLRLRKIRRPVDMVVSSLEVPRKLEGRKSCTLFYDCEKASWLKPYGNGEEADLKLDIKLSREPPPGERLRRGEPYRMTLTVARSDDGFLIRDVVPGSRFCADYAVPSNGVFSSSLKEGPIAWGVKDGRHFAFPHTQYCMMRLRTKRAPDGAITCAHYGRLMIGRNGLATCYFVISPNERSLEPKEREAALR